MATACESKTSGYAVMRWLDDGNRLSVHNLKYVIEPNIPVNSFKPSDNGTAKFPRYPGVWKFKILAVGGKKDMDAWLTERYQALTKDMTDSFLDSVESQPKVILHSSALQTLPDVAVITNQLNKSLAHTAQAHDEARPKVVLHSSAFQTSSDVAVITNQLNKSLAQAHDEDKIDHVKSTMQQKTLETTRKSGLSPKKSGVSPRKLVTPKKTRVSPRKLTTPRKTWDTPKKIVKPGTSSVVSGDSGHSYLQMSYESSGDRIQKLTEEVRSLKRRLRRLEDKFEANKSVKHSSHPLPQSPVQTLNNNPRTMTDSPSTVTNSPSTMTDSPSEPSLKDMMKDVQGDQNIFKFLCLKIFTENEIKNYSRTGKRSIKNMDNARPPLNATKLAALENLVKEHTKFNHDLFVKKFENLQKVLRRK